MATASLKAHAIDALLRRTFGFDRRLYIAADRCVPAPIGCYGLVEGFRDEISRKEYAISGLCQTCQDAIFAKEDE